MTTFPDLEEHLKEFYPIFRYAIDVLLNGEWEIEAYMMAGMIDHQTMQMLLLSPKTRDGIRCRDIRTGEIIWKTAFAPSDPGPNSPPDS